MDTYRWLVFLHVGSAVVWVGGAVMLTMLGLRISRAGTAQQLAEFGKQVEWFGLHYFMPLSVVTLAFGIAMATDDRWSFDMLWIRLGMLGYLVTFLTGAGFLGPQSGKLAKLVEAHGVEAPESQAKLRQLLMVARLDSVVLLLIVANMALKPGL